MWDSQADNEMVDPFKIIQCTATPAAVIDDQGRLLGVNRPAEVLFGRDLGSSTGRLCHEVFQGEDLFGNLFCQENCNILKMMTCEQPISCFEMRVRSAGGELLRVSVSTLVFPDNEPGQFKQVHLFQPLAEPRNSRFSKDQSRSTGDRAGFNRTWRADIHGHGYGQGQGHDQGNGHGYGDGSGQEYGDDNGNGHEFGHPLPAMRPATDAFRLTGREVEILGLLAHGKSSKDIGSALTISMSTVRNHLRNSFQKLEVHSQSEAVAYVLRNGIL